MSDAVAVIGLGAMGSRIAARLLAAGHETVVWNRSPGRADALVAAGARRAASPAAAASAASTVITMVADPAALAAVTEGADGILAAAGGDSTLIEMSTVGPAAVARLASALGGRAALVDAPVLGSLAEAEAGSLIVFAGGDEDVVDRVRPVLAALGTVVRVGAVGAGAAAKLVANSTLFTVLTALGETIALGRALGLEDGALYEVLAATPLAAQAERRRPALEDGSFPPRFRLSLASKDAELVTAAADEAGLALPVVDAARAWLARAESDGLGARDYTAVLQEILVRPSDRPDVRTRRWAPLPFGE